MAENTPYFDSITSARALLVDEEESLHGSTLISAESQGDLTQETTYCWIREAPEIFFSAIRKLPPHYQDGMLSYFLLSKTQVHLGKFVLQTSQTMASTIMTRAVEMLCACFTFKDGVPTHEQIKSILEKAGIEQVELWSQEKVPVKADLSDMLMILYRDRSYSAIATKLGLWRPDVRRIIRGAVDDLIASPDGDCRMLGSHLFSIVDSLAPAGQEKSKKYRKKTGIIRHRDSDACGQFRIRIEDPGWKDLFQPTSSLAAK